MIEKITVNTHSSIRIVSEKIIYCDPFKLDGTPHDADIVFVTHAHFDHFSPEDLEKIAKPETTYVMPESMKADAVKAGIREENLITLQPEQTADVCGIPVETVPSYNIGKPMHPKKNGWLGYILTVEGQRIYIGGDMDATPEAAVVKCDIAMIPIGGTYTMNAKEAAALVNEMRPKTVIPTHYGSIVGLKKDEKTFVKLVDEGISVVIKL